MQILRKKFPSTEIFPQVQGGWYAALHFDGEEDEALTLRLLEEKKILVQPGFLFDFDEDGWSVISLLSLMRNENSGASRENHQNLPF